MTDLEERFKKCPMVTGMFPEWMKEVHVILSHEREPLKRGGSPTFEW